MRLDAEHDKRWRHRVLLGVALGALAAGACTKTWVLGPDQGAGGAGGTSQPVGSGGFTFPGGTGGDHGDTGGHGAACKPSPVDWDIPKSSMVFLVGRDTAMSTPLGNGPNDPSRMTAVQTQLKNLITTNQYAINFGYLGFPSLVACPNGMACCLTGTEDGYSPPQGGAALSITTMLTSCLSGPSTPGCTSLNGARPIAQALEAADGIFSSSPPSDGDRVVVLIVDGGPDCPGDNVASKCSAEKQAVATLYNHQVKTYVIALGDDAQNDSCVQQIAGAGSSTYPSPVDDVPSLMSTLTRAMAPALTAACTLELTLGNYDPGLISVRFSDVDQDHEVPFDQNTQHSGWSFVPQTFSRIKINGSYCAWLQSSSSLRVKVGYGCAPCTQLDNCH